MSVSKYISNAETMQCGSMDCTKCKQKIESGLYLVVEHYVSKRGNEDDYTEIFHEKCSENDSTWSKYRKEQETQKIEAAKELKINKQKAKELINKAVAIEFGFDGEGNPCILYF